MKVDKRRTLSLFLAPALVAGLAGCERPQQVAAETPTPAPTSSAVSDVEPTGRVIEIKMYTIDPDDPSEQHVFKPRLVTAQVGDTIRFVPTEPSHQSSSIATMLPEGVEGWEGEVNEEFSYVVPRPGIYGYQCIPHYAAGMVGVIIVEGEGMTDNLATAQVPGHPGLGNPEFYEIFAEARERGLIP